MSTRIPLAVLIAEVTAELRRAEQDAADRKQYVMQFDGCEITAGIETEIGTDGKLKVFAVEIGAKGVQTTTNEVKLRFKALEDSPIVFPVRAESGAPSPTRQ